jgi:hypothetical protein
VPSSTMLRGRVAVINHWANGTCVHQALVTPMRDGRQNSGARSLENKGERRSACAPTGVAMGMGAVIGKPVRDCPGEDVVRTRRSQLAALP